MKKNYHELILLALLLIFLPLLPACKSSSSPIFFTSPSTPFPDVPVPASFTLLNSTGAGRYTDLQYQSTDDPQPIAQYFMNQLPKHGWVLQNQSQTPSSALLQFTKNRDTMLIEISNGASIRTNARIQISPATSAR